MIGVLAKVTNFLFGKLLQKKKCFYKRLFALLKAEKKY